MVKGTSYALPRTSSDNRASTQPQAATRWHGIPLTQPRWGWRDRLKRAMGHGRADQRSAQHGRQRKLLVGAEPIGTILRLR